MDLPLTYRGVAYHRSAGRRPAEAIGPTSERQYMGLRYNRLTGKPVVQSRLPLSPARRGMSFQQRVFGRPALAEVPRGRRLRQA